MKDSTAPPAGDRKKIMFYDTPDRQARFRIRCQYDEVTQSQFLRMMVTGYIDNDENILSYLDECKKKHGIQGKNKMKKVKASREAMKTTNTKFNLNKSEIESIFDVIETETGI
tara:strand:- start:802 stop:1140 length:339 start_codon:yes stop_codon:yes gene_type:complete